MKILSVNAGSSSLKFQMYEMPEEKVLISGLMERIGVGESFYTIKVNGEKEDRRGRKLYPNDKIQIENNLFVETDLLYLFLKYNHLFYLRLKLFLKKPHIFYQKTRCR